MDFLSIDENILELIDYFCCSDIVAQFVFEYREVLNINSLCNSEGFMSDKVVCLF